ncbi:MAG: hypothetical protein NWE96_06540 [Candidatus Bathyarchaeota archaeon]|nr:hypothetical protein [Candidatus Bathyarchaeota archaeon]
MNRKNILSLAIICILCGSLITFINYTSFIGKNKEQEPFYVGVTYGGNNIQDAKTLIDKVANYTNLFVLQSGILKDNATAVNEIGDYTVSKGLHFAAMFDVSGPAQNAMWVGTAKQRWGKMFVGVYLGDEPGGKMLDGSVTFNEVQGITVNKSNDGIVSYDDGNGCLTTFFPNDKITVQKSIVSFSSELDPDNSSITISKTLSNSNLTTYEPDGLITVSETITSTINKVYTGGLPYGHHNVGDFYQVLRDNFYTMENGSDRIAQEETYEQVKTKNPIPDYNAAANLFMTKTKGPIDNLRSQWNISRGDFPIFTSDYSLYWWDYKSGYDMVLAQLGWNNSFAQEIALVRGAANLQGKSWGTILTWKYTQAPFLADGSEIFNQMKTSYENGAQYVILFNYAESMSGPYGTLQEEHFQALERFWTEVVQNPTVIHGSVKAQAALVLPTNYGWGMRNPNDRIWGIWEPNSASNQTWTDVQSKLGQYGNKLDIVYSDSAYSVTGRYVYIYILNTTP